MRKVHWAVRFAPLPCHRWVRMAIWGPVESPLVEPVLSLT